MTGDRDDLGNCELTRMGWGVGELQANIQNNWDGSKFIRDKS